jgi:Predicted nucleic acid-binding protein, contains PIN domain
MAATEIVAVLDAGPLIHLDELGRLNLLNDFKELLVPQTVLDEALKHRPGLELGGLENLEIISEPPPLPADLLKLADELALHAGGRAALAVLKARGGQFLLSDDAAARMVARAVGFQTHGTIGLILRARRRGKVSKAEMLQLLRQLPTRTTLHLRKELLDSILATAAAENI